MEVWANSKEMPKSEPWLRVGDSCGSGTASTRSSGSSFLPGEEGEGPATCLGLAMDSPWTLSQRSTSPSSSEGSQENCFRENGEDERGFLPHQAPSLLVKKDILAEIHCEPICRDVLPPTPTPSPPCQSRSSPTPPRCCSARKVSPVISTPGPPSQQERGNERTPAPVHVRHIAISLPGGRIIERVATEVTSIDTEFTESFCTYFQQEGSETQSAGCSDNHLTESTKLIRTDQGVTANKIDLCDWKRKLESACNGSSNLDKSPCFNSGHRSKASHYGPLSRVVPILLQQEVGQTERREDNKEEVAEERAPRSDSMDPSRVTFSPNLVSNERREGRAVGEGGTATPILRRRSSYRNPTTGPQLAAKQGADTTLPSQERRSTREVTRSRSFDPGDRRRRRAQDCDKSLETLWQELQALDQSPPSVLPSLVSPEPVPPTLCHTRLVSWCNKAQGSGLESRSPSYVSPSPRMARAAALRSAPPTRTDPQQTHSNNEPRSKSVARLQCDPTQTQQILPTTKLPDNHGPIQPTHVSEILLKSQLAEKKPQSQSAKCTVSQTSQKLQRSQSERRGQRNKPKKESERTAPGGAEGLKQFLLEKLPRTPLTIRRKALTENGNVTKKTLEENGKQNTVKYLPNVLSENIYLVQHDQENGSHSASKSGQRNSSKCYGEAAPLAKAEINTSSQDVCTQTEAETRPKNCHVM